VNGPAGRAAPGGGRDHGLQPAGQDGAGSHRPTAAEPDGHDRSQEPGPDGTGRSHGPGPDRSRKPAVVLGVSAGIAAYKACELLRLLTESGHDVRVVPTREALRFVGEPTWAALSGNPVTADVWESVHEVPHVRIGQGADLVVVAPATADVLAKAAHGLAGDLLTNTRPGPTWPRSASAARSSSTPPWAV
jgi:phosphopantothenoylcysteine decarboxylase / phosphopantothenate---cysteine ligase